MNLLTSAIVLLVSSYSSTASSHLVASKDRTTDPRAQLHPVKEWKFEWTRAEQTTRQSLAAPYAQRLDRLDDQITALKSRCDQLSTLARFGPDFDHLKVLRAPVLVGLKNMQDPMVQIDLATQVVDAALRELREAVIRLTATIGNIELLHEVT